MIKIYHNPRCSKSRQTLELIRSRGLEPEIILYLENPPSAPQIKALLKKLGLSSARGLMRKGESIYKELGLRNIENDSELIEAMATHPKLIERPIVIKGEKAVLGRPPENVLALLS